MKADEFLQEMQRKIINIRFNFDVTVQGTEADFAVNEITINSRDGEIVIITDFDPSELTFRLDEKDSEIQLLNDQIENLKRKINNLRKGAANNG